MTLRLADARALADFVAQRIDRDGRAPSMSEIAAAFGYSHRAGACYFVKQAERFGLIVRPGGRPGRRNLAAADRLPAPAPVTLKTLEAVARLEVLGIPVKSAGARRRYVVYGMELGERDLVALAAKPEAEIRRLLRAAVKEQRRKAHNRRQADYQARRSAPSLGKEHAGLPSSPLPSEKTPGRPGASAGTCAGCHTGDNHPGATP